MWRQSSFAIETAGRSLIEVTDAVRSRVSESHFSCGLCHLFLHHTSASLILCENADPQVRRDLEAFMERLAPTGDPLFKHRDEGPDDMPAHVRTVLTQTNLSLPVTDGRLALGSWQGIYVWEHRTSPHTRRLTVTVQGEAS
jgi:secondary thiamine-phosphate synthase enzyme